MQRELYFTENAAKVAAMRAITEHRIVGGKVATKWWSYLLPDRSRVSGWTAAIILTSGQIVPMEAITGVAA